MTDLADFGSLKAKRSTNAFDSVEVVPSQRNFGTITHQKRPTINKLVSSVFIQSPSHHGEIGGDNDTFDANKGSFKHSLSLKKKKFKFSTC